MSRPGMWLGMLLHVYCCRGPWPYQKTPVRSAFVRQLMEEGMIEHVLVDDDRLPYEITDKGRAFIDHCLSLPLPEMGWFMPEEDRP